MKHKPLAPASLQVNPPKIEPTSSHSVIVDNSKTSSDSLLTHVSGVSFIVDYYRLVINKDNALYSQDVGQTGVQQQYTKYKNFELRQQDSLSDDQDDTDKVFTVKGTALVHSGLIPNEGDMFAGDVGDGRLGIFNVTRSQRMSIQSDAVYQIEYSLVYFTNDKPDSFLDLETKVIDTFFYVKDRLDYNDSPFLTTETYDFTRKLGQYYKEMSLNYFSWFFSKEFSAYIVPGQTTPTFDYFLYKALRVIFKNDTFNVLQKHQAINIDDDDLIDRGFDLFSVLLERSKDKFIFCDSKVGLTRTDTFSYEGATTNIRYTGIKTLIYPVSTESRVDNTHNRVSHSVLEGPLVPTPNTLDAAIKLKEITSFMFGTVEVPLVKAITIDDSYIFSSNFYSRNQPLSLLESLVLSYIDGKTINPVALKVLCDNYRYWPRLERFYYMPVLIILIQSILKDV